MVAQGVKFIRRGGIYPARKPRAVANRADMESAPTVHRGGCISRLAAVFPRFRRAGVHARRTLAVQNRGVRAAAGCGGMRASRPTFARAGAAIPFGRSCPDAM